MEYETYDDLEDVDELSSHLAKDLGSRPQLIDGLFGVSACQLLL